MKYLTEQRYMLAATLLTAVSHTSIARAEVAGEAEAESATEISPFEEIVVTAQKREQRLQDVPVSVAAFSESAMKNARIDSGTELARQTPNLRVSVLGNETQPKFSLRGVSTPDFNLNAISPTGVFYDEVYIGAQYLGGAQMFDMERVEVLRGPQGTLYGKNTTAGAINFISKGPLFEPDGMLQVGYGSENFKEVKAAGEVPLVADKLSVRVAVNYSNSDGFIKNANPDGQDLSNIDHKAGRLTLGYRDNEGFDATLRLFFTDSSPKAIGAVNTGLAAGGLNALGIDPRLNPFTGAPLGDHEVATDRSGDIKARGAGGYLTLNKDLGFGTLTSITSYVNGSFLNLVDADGSIVDLLHIDFHADNEEISQDLRIATNSDSDLSLIGGVYFYQDKIGVQTVYSLFHEVGGPTLDQRYDQKRTSYAAYVDGNYRINDAISVYAGLRYTDDKGVLSNFQVIPTINLQPDLKYHDKEPTGRLGLEVRLSDDAMVYGQVARGYRSSAFNGGALVDPNDVSVADPEKLDSYEIGMKSQWLDRRLTLNASAFLYDFKDQQFTDVVGVTSQQLVNAGASRMKGLELELVAMPTSNLRISGGLGILDGEFKDLVLAGIDLSGNRLIEAPKVTYNLALDYNVPLGDNLELLVHGDALHSSSQFITAANDPNIKIGAFWDVGARIAVADVSGKYEFAIYGKNLTDNSEPSGIVGDATSATRFTVLPYPRRFGVEFTIRY
ncbi:TonB-dependent receptor [Gimibacter soli]|uniref:TonB-dependent receptor n=1 Tax=Gimibacter soli TaxID=3024400 RepID=A0AAE9XXN2_9PROT|nr:TonB-dependent receptor [Gimibacter soli]WCL55599.1 TonB-dependent receptor [Gimibacter soli]